MRYEQSRWKSGTAISDADETECEGGSSVGNVGRDNQEKADAASACHSFWEEAGIEAGAKGARLSAGLPQQAGVGHFVWWPEPRQLHTLNGGGAAVVRAKMPCLDVPTLTRTASSSVKAWERRARIRFVN